MTRPLFLAALLVASSVLAGCTVPSGVNEEAYGHYPRVTDFPSDFPATQAERFVAAMETARRERPALADEWAYDAFLENATRWGREGFTAWDANRTLDLKRSEVQVALRALDDFRTDADGAHKELNARGPVRTLHAIRHGLYDAEGNGTDADALLAHARDEVAAANASLHAARENVTVAGRDALLRAEAVLGLALTQVQTAEAAAGTGPAGRGAGVSALDARFSAASVRWWLDLSRALDASATGADAARVAWPANLTALTEARRADVEVAIADAEGAPAEVRAAVAEAQVGLRFVDALLAAGLPEGAWAAAQGLRENIRVLALSKERGFPTPEEVDAAWADGAKNVRTFRDAQRYDVALELTEPLDGNSRYGAQGRALDHLRAYAALVMMRAITLEREFVLGETAEEGNDA